MSTLLDDLPEERNEIDIHRELVDYDEIDYNYNPNPIPGQRSFKEVHEDNAKLINFIFNKIKEPIVVSIITFIIVNPQFIKFLFSIPFVERFSNSTNITLAILAGCIYFIVKNSVM